MIPATSFLLDGDTALWVPPPHLPMDDWAANRPCDTCGGKGWVYGNDEEDPERYECDCDNTGRHTFTVEVACEACGDRHDHPIGNSSGGSTLRVHVLDVLPIYGRPATPLPAGTDRWIWHSPDDDDPDSRGTFLYEIVGNETVMKLLTLPPEAARGCWLVRLAVHQ